MLILKKFTILIILFFFLFSVGISQDSESNSGKPTIKDIKYPNIIKLNSLALAFNNISLVYERGILPRLSVSLGVGYKYKGGSPKIFEAENSTITADADKISGFSITPDARYYLKTCEPNFLEGLYGGLYFRYTHYTSAVNFGYTPENEAEQLYRSDLILDEYGAGILLGYQLVLWERFNIDFLFFGPRYSRYHLSYEFDQQPDQEFLDELSDYLNEVVDRFGLDYNVDIRQQGEAKASTRFSFVNARFGISLGFAF